MTVDILCLFKNMSLGKFGSEDLSKIIKYVAMESYCQL